MFSKDYDRKMKSRRRRKIVITTILIMLVLVLLFGISFKRWMDNYAKSPNNVEARKTEPAKKTETNSPNTNPVKDPSNNKSDSNTNNSNSTDEKTISAQLPDGESLSVVFADNNGTKKIEHIFLANNQDIYFNIDPTGDKAVVLTAAQDMYVVDLNGTATDITKDRYITSSTQETIMKKDYLTSHAGFSWHESPKFVNDTTIIYVTQMPWFQSDKYLYKLDLNTKDHQWLSNIQGKQITLNNLSDAGLEVNIDGNNKHINASGALVD